MSFDLDETQLAVLRLATKTAHRIRDVDALPLATFLFFFRLLSTGGMGFRPAKRDTETVGMVHVTPEILLGIGRRIGCRLVGNGVPFLGRMEVHRPDRIVVIDDGLQIALAVGHEMHLAADEHMSQLFEEVGVTGRDNFAGVYSHFRFFDCPDDLTYISIIVGPVDLAIHHVDISASTTDITSRLIGTVQLRQKEMTSEQLVFVYPVLDDFV